MTVCCVIVFSQRPITGQLHSITRTRSTDICGRDLVYFREHGKNDNITFMVMETTSLLTYFNVVKIQLCTKMHFVGCKSYHDIFDLKKNTEEGKQNISNKRKGRNKKVGRRENGREMAIV